MFSRWFFITLFCWHRHFMKLSVLSQFTISREIIRAITLHTCYAKNRTSPDSVTSSAYRTRLLLHVFTVPIVSSSNYIWFHRHLFVWTNVQFNHWLHFQHYYQPFLLQHLFWAVSFKSLLAHLLYTTDMLYQVLIHVYWVNALLCCCLDDRRPLFHELILHIECQIGRSDQASSIAS